MSFAINAQPTQTLNLHTFTSFPGCMDLFGEQHLKRESPESSHLHMKEYGLFVGLTIPNSLR